MSLAASAARGSAITLASQVVKFSVMMLSTIILARLLSPHDYGLIAMVTAIVGVAEIFRDFGLSMAALQAKDLTQQQHSNLFWINTGVGVVLSLIIVALAGPISVFYSEPVLVPIVLSLAITFTIGGMTTQFRVSINRQLRFVALALCDLLPYAIALVAAIWVAVSGGGYWALVAQQLTIAFAALVLSAAMSRWWPGLPRRGAEMGSLLKFGFSFAGTQLISYATRNLDSIAIGRVWGPGSLGMYDRAYQLVMMPLSQINTPLSRVAIPVLSRLTEDRTRYLSYLRQAQLIAGYCTASVFLLLTALGQPLVVILLGEQWSEAGYILSILAFGGVFRSIVQISYWMYMSQGMATQQLRFFAVSQPIVILVMLAGLPWGPVGVAIGNSVGFAAYWAASLAWAGRKSNLDVKPLFGDALRTIGLFGLPAAVIAFVSSYWIESDLFKLVVGVLGALAWYVIAWLVVPKVRADVRVLVRFVKLAIGRGK